MESIAELEQRLDYGFGDKSLLHKALRHSSYANEQGMTRLDSNERLEFLGDAVLEIVVSEFLYLNLPDEPEGRLSKLRASLVCEPTLAACARELGLGDFVFLSNGEALSGGRERKSILSDALEAVIGAMYLDGGIAPAKALIEQILLSDIEHRTMFVDSKTRLQELVQGMHNGTLRYRLVRESGPDHAKQFTVEVCIDERVIGSGTGSSKKAAEQEAAYRGLLRIRGGADRG